ncbi:MAG: tyrosine-protein phosphatase [Gammaproteobacteria bacterium]
MTRLAAAELGLDRHYLEEPLQYRIFQLTLQHYFMIDVREISAGEYEIDWREAFQRRPVKISANTKPESRPSSQLAENQVEVGKFTGLQPGARYYFHIEDESGARAIAAQRGLPLEGAVNFRDFGGYRTADGRVTRWGKFFRSGHLSNLSAADQDYLAQLNITTVCDFRRQLEIDNEPSLIPGDPSFHHVEIVPGARDPKHIHQLFAAARKPDDVFNEMIEIMRILVTDAAPHYRRLFEIMMAHEDGAFLMNCSAGKERTGVGAALVLMALGVPREIIEYEFMLSERYYPVEREVPRVIEKYDVALPGEAGEKLVMPLLETHKEYIRVVFEEIDKRFESDEQFIKSTYDLTSDDLAVLRDKYTEQL